MAATTIGEALSSAQAVIDRLDAQYLLSHLLGTSRASLLAHPERGLDATAANTYSIWIGERANGKPVAQITGTREFYGRDFGIDEHVLIPRPETEILVEQALARFSEQNRLKMPADRPLSILDMGTGSGAIAITLALERADIAVTAIDSSANALRCAATNAKRLNAQVDFVQSNWYAALAGQRFDAIVSNPPYVARDDPHLIEGDLRFEPLAALTDQSDDGLGAIRTIISGAGAQLLPGGWLLIEHGYDQAGRVRSLMAAAGLIELYSVCDLSGIERVSIGQRPHSVPANEQPIMSLIFSKEPL